MAEQKPADDQPRGTAPFVNDAADAPDQEPPAGANFDRQIAAEEALEKGHPNAGTIPLPKEDTSAGAQGAVKPQND